MKEVIGGHKAWLVTEEPNSSDSKESRKTRGNALSPAISKGRQRREAQNTVTVHLANLCIKGVDTNVLIIAYESIVINPFSESTDTVGAGMVVPAAQAGCIPMEEVFKLAVTSFKVYDWCLF